MARDISIMVTARDNYSDVIKKMQKVQTAFRKDAAALGKELDALDGNRASLKVETESARRELQEAAKAYRELGDEQSRVALETAQLNFDKANRNFKAVSAAANRTARDMEKLKGAASKTDNQLSGFGATLSQLAAAGGFAALGSQLGQSAGVMVSSALGQTAGNYVTGTVSGAAQGAALGYTVGGTTGAVVGGIVGGVAGLIGGATEEFEQRDEAYKGTVQDAYSNITQARQETLTSGKAVAGQRELDQISFSTLLGSGEAASAFLQEIRDMANKTPFLYGDLTGMARTLSGFGFEQKDLKPTMTAIGDAGAALGWDTSDMNEAASALGKMTATGKTTQEYLLPLIERGVPVWEYLSQAMGVTAGEAQEMVSKGLVPGAEAAKTIAEYMALSGEEGGYAGAMELQSKTLSGLESTLKGYEEEMDAAYGEGYSSKRKAGLEEQIAWYEGEWGQKYKEAQRKLGEWDATLENEQAEAWRSSIEGALTDIEENGVESYAELGAVLGEAEAQAKADYMEGPAYTEELNAQLDLIERLRDASLGPAYDSGYQITQSLSKGMLAGLEGSDLISKAMIMAGYTPDESSPNGWSKPGGKAFGMGFVPYDNFPALLHQGERVLTASQAREADRGSVSVTVTGNAFTVREDADVERIAAELARQLRAAMLS